MCSSLMYYHFFAAHVISLHHKLCILYCSHERISHHYAKTVKKSKKKDKLRNGKHVLMKSTVKGKHGEGALGKDKSRTRRFFLQRGDSTNSGHGFECDSDSDSDSGVDSEVFLEPNSRLRDETNTGSGAGQPRVEAVSSLRDALSPPRPFSPKELPPSLPSSQSLNINTTDQFGDKQPIPPRSPQPSSLTRPPSFRKCSDSVAEDSSLSSEETSASASASNPPPLLSSANKSPPLQSPPHSPRGRFSFVRKYSGSVPEDTCSSQNSISASNAPPLQTPAASKSPPCSPMLRPAFVRKYSGTNLSSEDPASRSSSVSNGTPSRGSDSLLPFPYLSLENLKLYTSDTSLESTSSASSFSKSQAGCIECMSSDNVHSSCKGSDSDSDSGYRSEGSVGEGNVTAELLGKVEEIIKDLNVLIIEDSNFQRKLMTRRMMNMMQVDMSDYAERWPVVSASNGEEALTMIDSMYARTGKTYDVLIVDEVLDGSGGILRGHEIIEQLRARHNMHMTLMIGCTANIKAYGEQILEAGANAVWAKPMQDPIIVRECIQKLLLDLLREGVYKKNALGLPVHGGGL
jgi:CheY-like chemotaxis protein